MTIIFSNTDWRIDQSLDGVEKKELSNQKIIKKGMRVAIFINNDKPILTVPINGCTEFSVLRAIHKGMNIHLIPGDRSNGEFYFKDDEKRYSKKTRRDDDFSKNSFVYKQISGYFDNDMRRKLITKYENGKLCPYELFGDHLFFEGISKLPGYPNVLQLHLGS